MTEPKNVNYIDFELMKKMCHPIAVALFDSMVEPITHFSKHSRALLEAALNNPRQTFNGNDLYPTFVKKAAILYYGIIKNHPFENGNKRVATAALLTFLFINDYWLKASDKESEDYLVEFAKLIAKSEGGSGREMFLNKIESWLIDNIEKRL